VAGSKHASARSAKGKDEIDKALGIIRSNDVRWVDLQFVNVPGELLSASVPEWQLDRDSMRNGFPRLDGSSVRGFTEIFESDMMLVPIPSTTVKVPWSPGTARILSEVHWGGGRGRLERDPRYVAEQAEEHQRSLGFSSRFGPEPEFFIFDAVRIGKKGVKFESREAVDGGSGGLVIEAKGGYRKVEPMDQQRQICKEIGNVLSDAFGVRMEGVDHEVASHGQVEINIRFDGLVKTADNIIDLKYAARNVAHAHNKVALFLPKPIPDDNGSGMHTHVSIWSADGKPLMYDENSDYAELSQTGRYVVGGILRHALALSAIVSPTVNSYRRLVPGFEAPVNVTWSASNRSAIIRIPTNSDGKGIAHAKRLEYRAPDPLCNPYLAFSAMLMAGLDGIKHSMDPGQPMMNENIYHMSAKKKRELGIRELPGSLSDALDSLESDSEFLKPVFSNSMLSSYVELKRNEVRDLTPLQKSVGPKELLRYMNI
jgi:glutamine synthetase